jgi:16S rRNA processing protein RimM
MGQFAAPHGVRGFSRVRTYTESPDALMSFRCWWVGDGEWFEPTEWAEAELKGDRLVARLPDVLDREAAQALAGREIAVPRDELPDTGDDEVYWADLVGLEVVNLAGEALGRVERLFSNGANDILVVGGDTERLIPCVDAYVREVDLEAGRLTVDWGKDY